jgi:short-subunit dehydrogenase involved in D-alanine esterification of teichoic acids
MAIIRLRKDRWVSLSLNPSYALIRRIDAKLIYQKMMAVTCPAIISLMPDARAPCYCAACTFVAAMSASLRNAITVTLRVR